MQIHELKVKGKKDRKRVGRGGKKGTYSGSGMKGQKSRSGYSARPTFAGGGTSIVASTKKLRGFKSLHPKAQVVNLTELGNKFNEGELVTPETLEGRGLIKSMSLPVKILSMGKLDKKLSFQGVAFSKAAEVKIKKVGGEIK